MKKTNPRATHVAVLLTSLMLTSFWGDAKASDTDIRATQAVTLLEQLETSDSIAQRESLVSELSALKPTAVKALRKYLARSRSSSDSDRRKVLASIKAAVPDAKGKFKTPKRQTKVVEKTNDNFDWLERLSKSVDKSSNKVTREVYMDVAVIRILASSTTWQAGTVVMDFAFSEVGLVFRDECGRQLRNMSPYSIPALIRGSQNRRNSSMKRYTNYQLERMDRQHPAKAFAAAPSEEIQIAVLNAFSDSQFREAVFVVLDNVNHVAPRVRKVGRAVWTEFVSGKDPVSPPKRKLVLPNGGLTPNKEALWLDHRELAVVAIQARIKEETGTRPNKRASLTQMTKQLFKFYDDARTATLQKDFDAAIAMANAGKAAQATATFDRILVQDPNFAERDQMVPAYLAQAEELGTAKDWKAQGKAFGKASAIAPDSEVAQESLKKHHLARIKAAQADGQDVSAEMAIVEEIEATQKIPTKSKLLLFAGLSAIAGALVFLILGLTLRRRSGAPA